MNSTITFDSYVPHIIVAGQGLATCMGNGLLLLTIILDRSLREQKEMLVIAGMATTDTVNGLGGFLFGVYRILIVASDSFSTKSTQWGCLSGSPFFVTNIGMQLSAAMNAFLSVDRFRAVAFPIEYRALSAKYVIKAFALMGTFGLNSLVAMFISSYFLPRVESLTRLCLGPPFPDWYNIFQLTFTSGIGLLSVFIYIGVYIAYRNSMKTLTTHERHNDQHAKVQQRLTVTIGVITISTLVLSIAPLTIVVVYFFLGVPTPSSTTLGVMIRASPVVHFAIYIARQQEIRRAMWRLITCKCNKHINTIQTMPNGRTLRSHLA